MNTTYKEREVHILHTISHYVDDNGDPRIENRYQHWEDGRLVGEADSLRSLMLGEYIWKFNS